MKHKKIQERLQKLAGIKNNSLLKKSIKLILEQNEGDPFGEYPEGVDPWLYGGGPELGGIPWHPTDFNTGETYPLPNAWGSDGIGPNPGGINQCTYSNNCCGELYFCEDCDSEDFTTVLDFMIQNNISEPRKVYMIDNSPFGAPNWISNQVSQKCVDPGTGRLYKRFTMFRLQGWYYDNQLLPSENMYSWAYAQWPEGLGDYSLVTYETEGVQGVPGGVQTVNFEGFTGVLNSETGTPYLANENIGGNITFSTLFGDENYAGDNYGANNQVGDYNGGLFGILEWLGVDTSLINSYQDLVNAFEAEGGQTGDVEGSCGIGSHGQSYCQQYTCYCARNCTQEDGTPCEHEGCMDEAAMNFDSVATTPCEDCCKYPPEGGGYICCQALVNAGYGATNEMLGNPCAVIQPNSWSPTPPAGNISYSDQGCVFVENLPNVGPEWSEEYVAGLFSDTIEECQQKCAPWEYFCTNDFANTQNFQNILENEQDNEWGYWEDPPYNGEMPWYYNPEEQITNPFWNYGEGWNVVEGGCVYAPQLTDIPLIYPAGAGSYNFYITELQQYEYFDVPQAYAWSVGLAAPSQVGLPSYKELGDCQTECIPLIEQDPIEGCTTFMATNYNVLATIDDGSCEYPGCTDPAATNFNPEATYQPTVEEWYEQEFGQPLSEASDYQQALYTPDSNYPCIYQTYSCMAEWMTFEWYDEWAANTMFFDLNQQLDDPTAGGTCVNGQTLNINVPPGTPNPSQGSMTYVTLEECEAQAECVYADGQSGCIDDGNLLTANGDPYDSPYPGVAALNYNAEVNFDDGSCVYPIEGCTDEAAYNYNPEANVSTNTCEYIGCTNSTVGPNPDVLGNSSLNEPCEFPCINIETNQLIGYQAQNYDPQATVDLNDDSCIYQEGCTDPVATNYDPYAYIPNNTECEYIPGCTDSLATNYNSLATQDDDSCEYESFICTPADSILGGTCTGVPLPPGSTFEWEFGVSLLTYATIEECEESGCGKKEKIKCWKCVQGFPVMQQYLAIVSPPSEPGPSEYEEDKGKGGCPEGWELAPEPWPYNNTGKNPCKKDPDRERDEDEVLEPWDPTGGSDDGTRPDDYIDDVVVGGPWFCPMDSGNFPWPGCCVQTGIDYSLNADMYPDDYVNANNQSVPNWLQTYFESPVGTTYSSNVECNANSGCGENMMPGGLQNCAGTYSPPPPDDPSPPGMSISSDTSLNPIAKKLQERLQKLAGIK